jgi:hypothetical protein
VFVPVVDVSDNSQLVDGKSGRGIVVRLYSFDSVDKLLSERFQRSQLLGGWRIVPDGKCEFIRLGRETSRESVDHHSPEGVVDCTPEIVNNVGYHKRPSDDWRSLIIANDETCAGALWIDDSFETIRFRVYPSPNLSVESIEQVFSAVDLPIATG